MLYIYITNLNKAKQSQP